MGRKSRKQEEETVIEQEAPIEVSQPVEEPALILVVGQGPVKRIHFDAPEGSAPVETPVLQESAPTQERAPAPYTPAPANNELALPLRRSTLYRTDHGNEVRAYEGPGGRTYTLTQRTSSGRVEERPFDSRQVDQVIRGVELEEKRVVRETVTETPATPQVQSSSQTETQATQEKKRRGFLGLGRKHKPGEDSGDSYRNVDTNVSAVTVKDASDAWEPNQSQTTVQASRPARVAAVTAPAPSKGTYYDFQGDDHPVIEIEGIGPEYATRLNAQGVYTTARLCYEDAEDLANRIDVPAKTVQSWKSMAELVKVKGIGPQYAEALARAGVTGIQEIKDRKPADIALQVQSYLDTLDSNVIGQKVGTARAKSWQKAAAGMRKVKQAVPSTEPHHAAA